jgi:hypothetical protein
MIRAAVALVLLSACGAKSPLEVEAFDVDASIAMDGGRDAGLDAGPDAGLVCVPGEVALQASELDVVFVIDRSGSMDLAYDGDPTFPGEPTRWEILESAMASALVTFDDARIAVGAKFFPSRSRRFEPDPCAVHEGLDVSIGPRHTTGVLAQFAMWNPAGGTPIGPAIEEATDALAPRADGSRAQFIVLATDGAPSCDESAEMLVVDAIRRAHDEHDIDVLVVGIASGVEELALDQFAQLGGRPRVGEEHAFYDARDPELLTSLLQDITRDLASCTLAVPIPPGPEDEIEVLVSGAPVPRDESRTEGWDWTSDARAQLGLFGGACEQAIGGAMVRAIITCH